MESQQTLMKKSNWHGGKGSQRRNSNEQAYRDNWDKIFGKKPKTKPKVKEPKDVQM